MYYISADQTSLLQVQWDFYIGTCLYVAYFCKTGNTQSLKMNYSVIHLYKKRVSKEWATPRISAAPFSNLGEDGGGGRLFEGGA